jgi:hypothetical protein
MKEANLFKWNNIGTHLKVNAEYLFHDKPTYSYVRRGITDAQEKHQ